jgi:hypothetical protein
LVRPLLRERATGIGDLSLGKSRVEEKLCIARGSSYIQEFVATDLFYGLDTAAKIRVE